MSVSATPAEGQRRQAQGDPAWTPKPPGDCPSWNRPPAANMRATSSATRSTLKMRAGSDLAIHRGLSEPRTEFAFAKAQFQL